MRLKGKCVLITAPARGSPGVGRRSRPARHDRRALRSPRRRARRNRRAARAAAHIVIQADVTGRRSRMLVNRIRERWGKLDVLINNAASSRAEPSKA